MIKVIIEQMNEGEDFKNSRLPMSLNDIKNEEGENKEKKEYKKSGTLCKGSNISVCWCLHTPHMLTS